MPTATRRRNQTRRPARRNGPIVDDRRSHKQKYDDYIRYDPQWKVVSKLVKERDNWTCRECGATSNLEAHHDTYQHLFHELDHPSYLNDLRTLCRHCHQEWHDNKKAADIIAEWENDVLKAAKRNEWKPTLGPEGVRQSSRLMYDSRVVIDPKPTFVNPNYKPEESAKVKETRRLFEEARKLAKQQPTTTWEKKKSATDTFGDFVSKTCAVIATGMMIYLAIRALIN